MRPPVSSSPVVSNRNRLSPPGWDGFFLRKNLVRKEPQSHRIATSHPAPRPICPKQCGLSWLAATQGESAVSGFIGKRAVGMLDNRHPDWLCRAIGRARGCDRIAIISFGDAVE